MTPESKNGIGILPFCRASIRHDEMPSMVERGYFDQTGLTENWQDNFLTYDEAFALIEPHAILPREGRMSVNVLQERFRKTPYEPIFQAIPEGRSIAVNDLFQQVNGLFHEFARQVEVRGEIVSSENDGAAWTSDKDYPEWQDRAITYRLAAQQLVPDLPAKDLDKIPVTFTRRITHPHQFVLGQSRFDVIRNPFDETGNHSLILQVDQTRVFEEESAGKWHERGALVFLVITEMVPFFNTKYQEPDTTEGRTRRMLLDQPLPGKYFNDEETRITPGGIAWQTINASFPTDLRLPNDPTMKKVR